MWNGTNIPIEVKGKRYESCDYISEHVSHIVIDDKTIIVDGESVSEIQISTGKLIDSQHYGIFKVRGDRILYKKLEYVVVILSEFDKINIIFDYWTTKSGHQKTIHNGIEYRWTHDDIMCPENASIENSDLYYIVIKYSPSDAEMKYRSIDERLSKLESSEYCCSCSCSIL